MAVAAGLAFLALGALAFWQVRPEGSSFYRLLQQAVGTDPRPLKDLIKASEPDDFT